MADLDSKNATKPVRLVRGRLPRVYAEALLNSAGDQAEAVGQELDEIVHNIFDSHPSVESYLASPAVSKRSKTSILEDVFSGRISPILRNMLGVLNQNQRLGLIRSIQNIYVTLLETRAGRVRVKVRSATTLSDDQREQLFQTLALRLGQQPVLDLRVEPELLGGLVVQVGDRVYDTSIRTRLETLRTQLLAQGTSYVANQN